MVGLENSYSSIHSLYLSWYKSHTNQYEWRSFLAISYRTQYWFQTYSLCLKSQLYHALCLWMAESSSQPKFYYHLKQENFLSMHSSWQKLHNLNTIFCIMIFYIVSQVREYYQPNVELETNKIKPRTQRENALHSLTNWINNNDR